MNLKIFTVSLKDWIDMKHLSFVEQMIERNPELINNTALGNCHCVGLNSFVIGHRRENPVAKIRLFIAEPHCELFQDYDPENPIIAIHPHKYDDHFSCMEGRLTHHFYKPGTGIDFNKYKLNRLSDKSKDIIKLGSEELTYIGGTWSACLDAKTLHSVSLRGNKYNPRCSWIVMEGNEDPTYEPIAYHQNLVKRHGLYTPIENGVEYIKNHIRTASTDPYENLKIDGILPYD